jgi:broad specificity phosphatase PhoE
MEEDYQDFTITERRSNPRENNIVIVRHAESIANSQGIYQGQKYDTDLSELGLKQAKALGERLRHFGAPKIITSPLKRTMQTANAIAEETRSPVESNQLILETNHGDWEGKSKDWIKESYPELYDLWLNEPSKVTFPGGESFMNTVERTLKFLETTELEPNTIVVTHDNILRAMISLIQNSDIDKMWKIPLETAALNFFEVNKINNKNVFRILNLNDSRYLGNLRNNINIHAL